MSFGWWNMQASDRGWERHLDQEARFLFFVIYKVTNKVIKVAVTIHIFWTIKLNLTCTWASNARNISGPKTMSSVGYITILSAVYLSKCFVKCVQILSNSLEMLQNIANESLKSTLIGTLIKIVLKSYDITLGYLYCIVLSGNNLINFINTPKAISTVLVLNNQSKTFLINRKHMPLFCSFRRRPINGTHDKY